MSFLTRVANGLGTLLGVLADTTVTLIQEVKRGYQEFQRRSGKTTQEVKSEAQRNRERLREVNDKIMYFRNRYQSGGLSERETTMWHDLKEERDELLDRNRQAKEVQAAESILENESVIEKVEIDLNTTHFLQYNAFADAINKVCRKCGRPMKLQWPRDLSVAGPRDFYWGCTGWYFRRSDGRKVCNYKEALTRNDFGLMTNTSEPEFELSAEDFGIIVDDPGTSSIILERVGDLRSDLAKKKAGVELAICPQHGEHMVLKKKSKPGGLLDTYFLACPHWKPNDEGCPYMEKLKSGAQLSALLKSQTGRGIL
jgi:hypothetical protein